MKDPGEKLRHSVEMACAARALARDAPSDHLRRVLGRYAFLHLHDVIRYGAAWRNRLLKETATKATAEAALPALERLRRDWLTYQEVRHFIAAKRQPRDVADAAADQLETFKLWADIGSLSVETLVEDAIELFVQLAALENLAPLDPEPVVPDTVRAALEEFDPIGEDAFLEINASSFGAGRPRTASVRMGGLVGRQIPLINDVGESAAVLAKLASIPGLDGPIRRLVTCALPLEIHELLRLTVGPPAAAQTNTPDSTSLLALYEQKAAPADALTVLRSLDASISQTTQEELLDWRNRVGAHADDGTPWPELEAGIQGLDLAACANLFDWIDLQLQHAACTAGGPVLLMLGHRRFKTLLATDGYEKELAYDESASSSEPGGLRSALPPDYADVEHVLWVGGPQGSKLSAGVAGMLAGRNREMRERLEAYQARQPREKRQGKAKRGS
ncbi:MAG: hypothetical protein QOJ29_4295 [Thermoleophilaceae bacterium]|jgi:hypothetical protein|nr:hypothetical protein [Thermoleophilaceae bacterium]